MAYNPFTQGIKQRSATGYSRISARDLDDMIGAGLSYQSTAAAKEAALRRQAEADALEKANYEAQLALDEKKHDELVNAQKDAAESSKWQGIANTAGQLGTTVLALGGAKPIMGAVKALPETLGSAYQYGAGVVDNTFGTTLSQAAREAALNATIDDVLATGTAPQMSQATANLIGNTSATGLESASSLTPEIAPQMLDAGYSEALSNVGGNVTSALDSTVANTVAEKAAEQVAQQATQQAITEGTTQIAPTVSTVPSATEPIIEGGLSTGSTPLESTVGTGAAATTDVIAPTTLADAYAAGGVPGAIGNIAGTVGAVTAPVAAGYSAPALLDYIGWMPEDGVERGLGVTSAATGAGALTGALTALGGPIGAVLGAMGGGIYGFTAGGPTEGEMQDKNMRELASKLEEYAKANPDYVYSSKDSPIDYNKYLGYYASGPIYDTQHGFQDEYKLIANVPDLSDETINRLIHEGKFRSVVGQLISGQQQTAYDMYNSANNPFAGTT